VRWTGPNNEADYVTVVAKGATDGAFLDHKYTKEGNPLTLTLPTEAGDFELRYNNDNSKKVLARRPIALKLATYALEAPAEAMAGSRIEVKWTGPSNPRDYITIVKKGAPVGSYTQYFYTRDGNPGQLQTSPEPGEYELRYSTEDKSPNPTLASRPILLKGASYKLEAPAEGKAGSEILVKWTGPGGPRDYVTIVKKGAPVGTFTVYFYTRDGNPGKLKLPSQPGEYELRYSSEVVSPNPTLFSLPIAVK
jgi:Ca-activated chloride channel family protein